PAIAQILGISSSAVETLLFRARRALREQLEGALTCHQAELAISRQLDGRLPRSERGALRAHLRACPDCATVARRQRAQRAAFKSLAAVPLPTSLASLVGGGGGAAVATGVATKAAAVLATGALVGGLGYEGARHTRLIHSAPRKHVPAETHVPAPAPIAPALSRGLRPVVAAVPKRTPPGHVRAHRAQPAHPAHPLHPVRPLHPTHPVHPVHPSHPAHARGPKPKPRPVYGRGRSGKAHGRWES